MNEHTLSADEIQVLQNGLSCLLEVCQRMTDQDAQEIAALDAKLQTLKQVATDD